MTKKMIEKNTQVKYFTKINATIINAIEEVYSNLNRIDETCGNRYITAEFVRFIDHDCKFNAKLKTKNDYIIVIAFRNIQADEKITVYYVADFFNRSNQNCCCAICKFLDRINARSSRKF